MNSLSIVVLILMVLSIIQVIEEVRKDFRTKWPLGELSKPTYSVVSGGILVFGAITLVLAYLGSPAAIVLAWILAIFNMANGVWLLIQMLVTTGYFPGGYSASFVLLAAISLMVVLA
jgi:hypothetical protein